MHSLIQLIDFIPDITLDLRYATTNNITGRVLYPDAKAYVQRDVAEALRAVQTELSKHDLGLAVWDAYRPQAVSHALWEVTPESEKHYVADPTIGSVHNRGCAVDVTLVRLATGQQVSMPSGFDDFSERAWPSYDDAPKDALASRDLLRVVMENHGFIVNPHEWWHFDWHDWQNYPVLDTPIEAL
jgi:D-alanyl-D-alanine dipeptidase